MELPKNELVGAPAGVNDAADDGGGPAGVVEGLSPRKEKPVSRPEFLSGVAGLPGGLESSGTMNLYAMTDGECCYKSFVVIKCSGPPKHGGDISTNHALSYIDG